MYCLFGARFQRMVIAIVAGTALACGGGGSSSPPVPAGMPQDVNAAPGDSLNTITWSADEGATSYNLYWSTNPGVTTANGTKVAGVSSPYSHTSLTNGTAYYYVVSAVGATGESSLSAEVTAKPTIGSAPNLNGIAGTVKYQYVPATKTGTLEFTNAVLKPVRNATVQVLQGTTPCGTASVTDETGYYSIDFTPCATGQLFVRVLAKTTTPAIQVEDNTDSNAVWAVSSNFDLGTHVLDITAAHGWTGSSYDTAHRVAAPFAILDSMYTAAKAFLAARSTIDFPLLKVNWSPDNVPEFLGDNPDPASGRIGTSHYSPTENEIYVLGKEGVDTDEFDNHVIAHEWGHYFENNLSRSDSPGGPHSTGDILDPRLAFGEGYGDAIAAIALHATKYVDTMWNSNDVLTAFGFDAETAPNPTDDPSPGAFSEMSILRLLYDLYDSGSNETFDPIGVGLGTFYDVLVGPEKTTSALTTIASFVTGLKAQSGVVAANVDTLMAHYNIGPITDEWGTGETLGPSRSGGLQAMYVPLASLPASRSITYTAGAIPNQWEANQYYVITGTGSSVTVSGSSEGYFVLTAYRQGTVVDEMASASQTGTLTFVTTNGEKYVVVVTGYTDGSGQYAISLSFE